MSQQHAARHAPRQVRQYLTTTPTQHYSDQAKLALFDEAVTALRELFEHCSMVHKHWGEGSNQREADAAVAKGRALLAKVPA